MTKDDVLAQLGAHVREAQKDDAALEAIARGDASAPDAAALAEREPEFAEAARPLDSDRIAARVLAQSKPARESTETTKSTPARLATWKKRATMLAGPVALAAAMILYITASGGPSAPELPPYAVSAHGEQALRGDAPADSVLHVGTGASSRFEIVARPANAAGTRVAAWAFTMGEAEPNPLDASIDVSEEGSVRIRGESRALRGARELRVVIAPAEAIAKYDEPLARAKAGTSDAHARVLVVRIER